MRPPIALLLGLAAIGLAAGAGLAQGVKDMPGRAAPPVATRPPVLPRPDARAEPNRDAPPSHTTLDLQAGFEPDPRTVAMQAGGDYDATRLGGACTGMINGRAPDVDVNYRAGGFPLSIYARSAADTVLVVNDPEGRWHCNDDTHGLNPAIAFPRPLSGKYHIWVGVIGAGPASATLAITELPVPAR